MNHGHMASLAVALLVMCTTAFVVHDTATSEDFQKYMDNAGEWCERHDGRLVNVQAVIGGGLHCELPNGTSVHMSEIEAVKPT